VSLTGSKLLQSGPFRFGFIATLGVLLGLALGLAVGSLGYPLTLIFLSLFVSVGLYPVVARLESLKIPRAVAVLVVIVGFLALAVLLIWAVVPVIVSEAAKLLAHIPAGIDEIEGQDWFVALNDTTGGGLLAFVDGLSEASSDPSVWAAVSGGALRLGAGILNATVGTVFVIALTAYFVGSMEMMKRALYALVPASRRDEFAEIAEEIFRSVGKYLTGMFTLAVMNGLFTFVLLSVVGVPYAPLLAVLAVPITFIPVVGTVINTGIVTVVSLFDSPQSGLIVLLGMLVYMQVEAYVFTPRIVGKAIRIPGQLVLIGAMVGATLLGLLGALVACPVTASLLLIVKKIVVPAQQAR